MTAGRRPRGPACRGAKRLRGGLRKNRRHLQISSSMVVEMIRGPLAAGHKRQVLHEAAAGRAGVAAIRRDRDVRRVRWILETSLWVAYAHARLRTAQLVENGRYRRSVGYIQRSARDELLDAGARSSRQRELEAHCRAWDIRTSTWIYSGD
jgi:hypothetical protein